MFLYPALTIGFLFVAVPLLVHLINMLRHRRQPWAAMDFLLASYRKQKKWIILRQLMLLLARTAVAATLIALLCGWVAGGRLLGAIGGKTTHHLVILDDSYSMGDRSGPEGAYGGALAALQSLTERLARSDGNHELTVLRSSRAALVVRGGGEAADAAADLAVQTINGDTRIVDRVLATEASSISCDLVDALRLAGDLIGNTPADETVVYLLSDFRQRDWEMPERVAEVLQNLDDDGTSLRCIDCASAPSANLAITRLEPIPDVWVAGVPVVVQLAVQNYGTTTARNVNVATRLIRYGPGVTTPDPASEYSGEVDGLPGVVIESLEPGEEAVRQFQVFVTETGRHAIEARLPDDVLAIDNQRVCTLPLTDVQKVLIVEGDGGGSGAEGQGSYHLQSALDPGGQVRTGAIPEVRPPSFLRSATLSDLQPYRAIYLLDLPEVSETTARTLSQYVERGGGLAWFLGSATLPDRLSDALLDDDRMLLPGRLQAREPLAADSQASDLSMPAAHPLTEPLAPLGDAAFARVGIQESWGIDREDPRLSPTSPVRVVLERRDGRPFVLEHAVGAGRVVTVLGGVDGDWTNWQSDPTFVVFILRTNAFLWSDTTQATARLVDEPLRIRLPAEAYSPSIEWLAATAEPPRVPLQFQATEQGESLSLQLAPQEAAVSGDANLDLLTAPGISEFWLTELDGRPEVRAEAAVIETGEGDLSRVDQATLRRELQPIELSFLDAESLVAQSQGNSGGTTTLLLLATLGMLLAGEQALAYWASYHPPAMGGKR